MLDIIAQGFGIIGLVIIVLSFQCKKNSNFFIMQGTGSFMFFLNFILIGAYGGAFFNLCNLIRGLLFSRNAKKVWKLIIVELVYLGSFIFSLFLDSSPRQILLVAIPCLALIICSVFMWVGNAVHIRYYQIAFMSPAWIIHNIFNLSIGGLICECFNMVSSVVYLLRLRAEKRRTLDVK